MTSALLYFGGAQKESPIPFCMDPDDPNIIMIGTGEAWQRSGTGLYKSTDSGLSWRRIALSPEPSCFYRIRHAPTIPGYMFAATTAGFYRSTDHGETWTRTLTGNTTDLAWDLAWGWPLYVHIQV